MEGVNLTLWITYLDLYFYKPESPGMVITGL